MTAGAGSRADTGATTAGAPCAELASADEAWRGVEGVAVAASPVVVWLRWRERGRLAAAAVGLVTAASGCAAADTGGAVGEAGSLARRRLNASSEVLRLYASRDSRAARLEGGGGSGMASGFRTEQINKKPPG